MGSPHFSEYFPSNSNDLIQNRNYSKCKYEIVFWVTSFKWVSPQEKLDLGITTLSEYLPENSGNSHSHNSTQKIL